MKDWIAGQADSWHMLPPRNATMRIFRWDFFRKLVCRHDAGLGESYIDGDFEVGSQNYDREKPVRLATVPEAHSMN